MSKKVHMMTMYSAKIDKVEQVKEAITEFVIAVKENEPETLFYEAYQGKGDMTFVHIMTFENSVAEQKHRDTDHMGTFVQKLYPNCQDEPGFIDLELVKSNVR